MIPQLSVRIE